jgi:hypothetical protein
MPLSPQFVVMKHLTGTLALGVAEIGSAWYRDGTIDQPSVLRLVSPALSEPKTLGGAEGEELWRVLSEGAAAGRFVLLSHQGGTLAVAREQIRTAFRSEDGRLRVVYDADPSGKTVDGDEAARVWKLLTE